MSLDYQTSELEIAAFLKARGHHLLSAKLEGRVVAFDSMAMQLQM